MSLFQRYVSRWDFIRTRCASKRVLHLGCLGMTECSTTDKVVSMRTGRVLHAQLREACHSIVGVDYDVETVQELQQHGFDDIVYGDVQHLDQLALEPAFDVIVCGDLIEHLGKPDNLLAGVKDCMAPQTELIISTPNAFGLLHFARYLCNVFREGNDHVLSFSIYTLHNLLQRHGLTIAEAYTCYCTPPTARSERLRYALGTPFFQLAPKLGGTLLVVARLA